MGDVFADHAAEPAFFAVHADDSRLDGDGDCSGGWTRFAAFASRGEGVFRVVGSVVHELGIAGDSVVVSQRIGIGCRGEVRVDA